MGKFKDKYQWKNREQYFLLLREITRADAVQVLLRIDREELLKEAQGVVSAEGHDPFALAYEKEDQAERQRIYELLHRRYGCRIYR